MIGSLRNMEVAVSFLSVYQETGCPRATRPSLDERLAKVRTLIRSLKWFILSLHFVSPALKNVTFPSNANTECPKKMYIGIR